MGLARHAAILAAMIEGDGERAAALAAAHAHGGAARLAPSLEIRDEA